MPALSVVAPVYNEAECIREFIDETCRELDGLGRSYELICVDDGSADQTLALLTSLRTTRPVLRPISLDGHHGQSAALRAGIEAAEGDVIVLTDADLQNDPRDIGPMLSRMDEGWDCIVGVRTTRQDSWLRRLSSRIANWVARRLTRHQFRDGGCGLKLGRASLMKRLPFFRGAHRLLPALAAMEGGRVLEWEVRHRPRRFGQSKYGSGLGRTFGALRDALGVRWMLDRKLRYGVKEIR